MTRPEDAPPLLIDRRLLLKGAGVTGALVALGAAGAGSAAAGTAAVEPSPAPAACRQLVAVHVPSSSSTVGTLNTWQRGADGAWRHQLGPLTAHVGSLGVGKASEGAQITPAGTFAMDVAFGRQPDPGTAMPYFRTDPLDWWDENPTSPTYNLHVRRATSPGGNSENLYYSGPVYDYAVNILHNPKRTPYAGSGIFLHVTDGGPTAGCVSISRSSLVSVLRWMNPAMHPYATIRVGGGWNPPRRSAAQSDNWVRLLYTTVTGAAPSAGQLAAQGEAVRLGADLKYVTDRVATSTARYHLVIHRGYRTVLGRNADATGLRTWTSHFARGGGVDDLMVALARSNDAWARAGKDFTTWVQRTCVALVGRKSVNPATWVSLAQRSGRTAAAAAITRTPGFAEYRLNQLYRQMLGVAPSAAAVARYSPRMHTRGDFSMPGVIASGTAFWSRAQR